MPDLRPAHVWIGVEAAAALIGPLTELVIRAGAAILAVNRCAMKVDGKSDGSPVTEADLAADRIIAEGLARLAPQIPSLSEERAHLATPPYKDSFFLIDPLDGTKEFVAGRNEFTVNLALVTGAGRCWVRRRAGARAGLARTGRPRRRTGDRRRRRDHCGRADPHPALPATRPSPGRRRSAAPMAMPGPRPSSRAAGRDAGAARLGRQIRPGRGGRSRHLSPPRPHLANGTSRRAMRWSRRPAAR